LASARFICLVASILSSAVDGASKSIVFHKPYHFFGQSRPFVTKKSIQSKKKEMRLKENRMNTCFFRL
jgi:hypothetical protein